MEYFKCFGFFSILGGAKKMAQFLTTYNFDLCGQNLMKPYIMQFQHVYLDCMNFGINQIKITEMTNLLKSHVKKLHIVK